MLWLHALKHSCFVMNHTSSVSLQNNIPLNVLTGVTQDISMFLQFHFCQAVCFREDESHFLSASNEKLGWFIGFAEHVGHALTHLILTKDTRKILSRSVVCPADDDSSTNL